MKLKAVAQWAEAAGASPPPWINGDWQTLMSVLARLLADNLIQRFYIFQFAMSFRYAFFTQNFSRICRYHLVIMCVHIYHDFYMLHPYSSLKKSML